MAQVNQNLSTATLEKKISTIIGIASLVVIGILALYWLSSPPTEHGVTEKNTVNKTSTRTTLSRFSKILKGGSIAINQYDMACAPIIDRYHEDIVLEVKEDNVWVDWWVDGNLYREMPRCFSDHKDVVIPHASSFCFRVTPGTQVGTATVSWTITQYAR